MATERKLGVDPADFRLWVCLHEVTHQLQFTAVPWLRPPRGQVAGVRRATDLTADVLRERLQDVLRSLADAVRGGDGEAEGLMALIQDPRSARSSTGHRGDEPGRGARRVRHGRRRPGRRPLGEALRKRFAQRRKGRGPIDRVLRRLLGLEQKMKQYAEGRVFVGGVIDLVGMDGFNQVWAGPPNLPLIEELTEPGALGGAGARPPGHPA